MQTQEEWRCTEKKTVQRRMSHLTSCMGVRGQRFCLVGMLFVAQASLRPLPAIGEQQSTYKTDKLDESLVATYDVTSIKPSQSTEEEGRWGTQGDTFFASNVSLRTIIVLAYAVRSYAIEGLPKWADERRFDIVAKMSNPSLGELKKLTGEDRRRMLREMLKSRFHLRTNSEMAERNIYDLRQMKKGTKISKAAAYAGTPEISNRAYSFSRGRIDCTSCPINTLKGILADLMNADVIDHTKLTELYDIHLTWSPEEATTSKTFFSVEESAALLSSMKEELGLELLHSKGLIPVVRITDVAIPESN